MKSCSPKLRRRVLRVKSSSPSSPKSRKTESWKRNEEDSFGSENESPSHPPPSKAPRISLTDQTKVKTKGSDQQNCHDRKPACAAEFGLVAACKELVNLAVARGSLDDITVMIVDLSFFK